MSLHPHEFTHRLATLAELPELERLMDASIRTFIGARLDAARVEASFDIMGVDTQLIEDGTYFVDRVRRSHRGLRRLEPPGHDVRRRPLGRP